MRATVLAIFFLLCAAGICRAEDNPVRVVTFDQLQTMMRHESDTTFVYNFFATWCDPCVAEFPALQAWAAEQRGRHVALVFVSLDFKKNLRRSFLPFLRARRVTNTVVLLDAPDYNSWINRVDTAWDGALPMTLVVNTRTGFRRSFARAFTRQQLDETLTPILPQP